MGNPTIHDARNVLKRAFGYDNFRPGQEAAVSAVLEGRDTVVVLPTGGGKSLCYQVPALMLPGLTVVVSPLISLMKDQVDALAVKGLPAAFIHSTLTALNDPATIITGFDRPNLTYYVVPARNEAEKEERLAQILRNRDGLAVIYASTRRAVDQLTGVLERAKIRAAGYHAGLDDARRREVQEAFMSEKVHAIVATNAFGMGIDKPNVRLVIHYAMPGTLEAYYPEAGRAGRDGLDSDVFLLHAFPD